MKTNTIKILFGFVLPLFVISIVSCNNSKNTKINNQNVLEEVQKDTINITEEKTQYQCPMKCEGEKIYHEPGDCPRCKMDLEEIVSV